MMKNASHPVVITRPLAQAVPLAQRVRDVGRVPVVFPLLDILPLPDSRPLQEALADLHDYAMVAFVSPNAIDAAFAWIKDWPQDAAIAVVGEGSKAALARHGVTVEHARIISPADPRRSDSQGLLQALDVEALRGKRVLIIRGESGRELLADALQDSGVEVRKVAAYRRAAPELNEEKTALLKQLIDGSCDWIITSSEALRNLIQLSGQIGQDDLIRKLQEQHLIVPHIRIEETARILGFQHITLTGSGDEQLLAALQSHI
ncbi:uroporphyrinogen-III synthase [Noviherbaspirillum massiliense]|uniref:uroporphyrinogen-III synthase n=1 Tax=Noviherbaspirillum massiliense TaxID=1465823 RepID=UPI0002E461EF|nr:uroporphyrinogen-III synthase [Noviherbaspirillum massiliense]